MKTILRLFAAVYIVFIVLISMPKPKIPEVNEVTKETSPDPKFVALRSATVDVINWWTSRFGTIMLIDATVTNPMATAFKDYTITCTSYDSSGTEVDSNRRTIYDFVPPKSVKHLKAFNTGFVHSQSSITRCELTDLVLGSPAEQVQQEAEAEAMAEREQREGKARAMHSKLLKECAQYKGQPKYSTPITCFTVMAKINTE